MLAAAGAEQIVGILDPFGNAFERGRFPDVVKRQKGAQRVVRDFGVNGHVPPVERPHQISAMAVPLNGVYKAGQSPSFAAGRRPWGLATVAGEFRAGVRLERIMTV